MNKLRDNFVGWQAMAERARSMPNKTIICSTHGAYEAAHYWAGNKIVPYGCPECKKINDATRVEDERQEQAQREAEAKRRKLEKLLEQSNVPVRFAGRTLQNYKVVNDDAAAALKAAREYADSFEQNLENGKSMIFTGKVGTGKTHLAIGIAHEIMKRDFFPLFMSVAAAIRHVKKSWRRDADRSDGEFIGDLVAPDLLILDEAGVQFGSDTEKLIIFDILNQRYEQVKPTIVLSNLSLVGITECLGERVIDRLREGGGVVQRFEWSSYRSIASM